MAAIDDFLALELRDQISALQAGFLGRTIRSYVTDQCAFVIFEFELFFQSGVNVLDHYAEITAGHATILYQTAHHVAGDVHRDGEADALVATAAAQDGGVDTN